MNAERKLKALCLLALFVPLEVFSQTACPVGVAAGSAQCGPSPAEHVPSNAAQAAPTVRYVPTGKWRKTWGAIASDFSTGDTGVSVGKSSEREAVKDAIMQCSKGGSQNCRKGLTYRNACVALVGTDKIVENQVSVGLAVTGESVEAASAKALQKCRSKNVDASSCTVAYADCSKPIFEKF